MDSRSIETRIAVGKALVEMKEYKQALEIFRNILLTDPFNGIAVYYINWTGFIISRQGILDPGF